MRGDVAANVERHLQLVPVAAGERAEVLVFPELLLTGYEMDLAAGAAFSPIDPRLAPLVEAASSHSMTLVAGGPVRLDSRLHIGAFIISPDRTVGLYTKHRLGAFTADASCDGVVPPAEATVFQARRRSGARGPTSRACSSFPPSSSRRARAWRGRAIMLGGPKRD